MKTVRGPISKLSIVLFSLGALVALGIPMCGQEAPAITVGDVRITGVVDDWSHHHLVFSNPGTADEAMRNGTYEQWLKITKEPRYIMHQLKRGLPAQGPFAEAVAMRQSQTAATASTRVVPIPTSPAKKKKTTIGKDWSMSVGSGGHLAAGQYPAKYNFYTNTGSASCGDFVVYPTGLAGAAGQATIVAYTSIYATACGTAATRPGNDWAYNTGGGTSTLSPVLSGDGSQVAYIQTAGSVANLVLLKPLVGSGGTVAAPTTIATPVATSAYRACNAPCYTSITLSGTTPTDTNSAPFYDYGSDVIYVGDNLGTLHKFTNIFLSGTPAETTGGVAGVSGWPQAMAAGVTLTSPVYDSVSGNVFVSSNAGIVYRIGSAGGAHTASGQIGVAAGADFVDAPLIDSMPATPLVYVFVGDASSAVQLSATFTSGNMGTARTLGSSATTTLQYVGAFDNLHYTISGGTAGNLYVCGYHSTGTTPRLYQIVMPFSATSTVNTIATDPASTTGTCSPVTEFLGSKANTTLSAAITTTSATTFTVASITGIANGDYVQIDSEIMRVTATPSGSTVTVARGQLGTVAATHLISAAVQDIQDWIYLSVSANGVGNGCTGACLYNYAVTTGTAPAGATTGITATAGTSGIIIDNSATTPGESQIYYNTLGNQACVGNGTTGSGTAGCAVQASQSAP